jgi:uncharacterized membrane protein
MRALVLSMHLPKLTSPVLLAVFIICLAWLALVVSAPFLVPSGTLLDLSGSVNVKDNTALFHSLSPLPKAIYTIGDVECHQIASRSFFLNGNEMPFCARDLGLFLGLAAGFGLAAFYRYKLNPFLALAGLVPMGIDGGLQLVTSYESNNALRIITGVIAGVSLAILLAFYVFLIQADSKKKHQPGTIHGTEGNPKQE